MTTLAVENPSWGRRRWVLAVLALLGIQVGLILWLSRPRPFSPPASAAAPKVFLATGAREPAAGLSDPTLYVLANRRGFSGEAWLEVPPLEYDLPKWSDEKFRPFQLPVAQLGSEVGEFLRSNQTGAFELAAKPQPVFDTSPPTFTLGNPASRLTVEGELAKQTLLSSSSLNAWPDNDILTNSEVGVLVDARGNVFSAVLLASCGANTDTNAHNADAAALALAASARFQPRAPAGPVGGPRVPTHLQWGKLVFHWQTVTVTNSNRAIP